MKGFPYSHGITKTVIASWVALAVNSTSAWANSNTTPVIDAILACRGIANAEERLACQDDAIERLSNAVQTNAIVVVERERAVAVERESFGMAFANPGRVLSSIVGRALPSADNAVQQYDDGVVADRSADGEIEALRNLPVRTVSQDLRGRVVVTLQNGQVWRQVDNRRLSVPRSVDGVTLDVERGALGSFFMSLSTSSISVRAQRD